MTTRRRIWVGVGLCWGVALAGLTGARAAAAKDAEAVQVHGAEFPVRVTEAEGAELILRGAGLLRYLGMVPVYAAALYVAPDARTGDPLGNVAKRLEVEYLVAVDARRFTDAGDRHLRRALSAADFAALEERLVRINGWYPDPKPGDRCAITYTPGVGTSLLYNGKRLGTVPGEDFQRAYFGIWLGDPAASDSLREDLLGKGGARRGSRG